MQQLGELVIATGADAFSPDELAGALIVLAETTDTGKEGGMGQTRGCVLSRPDRGDLLRRLRQTLTALRRNRAARNRHQAVRARHDMRSWQVERRKRTRHLIELGGLVVKAGIVDLTGDDRVLIYGALIWMAEKLREAIRAEQAREVWTVKGKQAFEADREGKVPSNL